MVIVIGMKYFPGYDPGQKIAATRQIQEVAYMAKNILIISSNYTGHGHKSITESLMEQLSAYPDVKVHVIDGFELGGNIGTRVGKLYGSVTRNAKEVWKIIWDISMRTPTLINEVTELTVKESFLDVLRTIRPDMILSVHPNYNGSVLNILEEYNIRIPFAILIADLVSISPLWADIRADYILCPTIESKYKCLEFGMPEDKLIVTGFPVRSRFTRHIEQGLEARYYSADRPLECLIMSGGEGVGNMNRIAEVLLDNFNTRVKIIAGRNAVLKRRLEKSLKEPYGDRVEIHGFTENVQDLMLSSDIAFTRGSPNTMMEAVSCNVPLVITGALPGQEEGNPGYLEKYNLGIVCKELSRLKEIVSELLSNDAEKLNRIKKSQQEFRNPHVARDIANILLEIESANDIKIPPVKRSPIKKLSREIARARRLRVRRKRRI